MRRTIVDRTRTLRLGIVGAAGECAVDKIIPALNAHVDYKIAWAVDARPRDETMAALHDAGARFDNAFTYRRESDYLQEFPSPYVDAVIEAVPSNFRANIVVRALNNGIAVYAEKPMAVSFQGIRQIERAIGDNRGVTAYFSEYYGREKGIAMEAASGLILPGDWHEQFFVGGIDSRLQRVMKSLGEIEQIVATTLEGEGKKSGISHRLWVGDIDQGGQLLDMSTHLFTFLPVLRPYIGDVSIERVRAGKAYELESEYREKTGQESAETYAEVYARASKGAEIVFSFGKYTGVAERIFKIKGKNGVVSLDFESQVMTVESPEFNGLVRVNTTPKYTILMKDFERRVRDPALHFAYGFDNARDTMALILSARALPQNVFHYEAGNIPGLREIIEKQRRL